MTQLRRLLDDAPDDFTSKVLEAAADDAPSAALRGRILDGFGGGGGGGGGGGAPGGTGSSLAPGPGDGLGVSWKGIAIAAVGTAIVVAALLSWNSDDPRSAAGAPNASTVTTVTAMAAEPPAIAQPAPPVAGDPPPLIAPTAPTALIAPEGSGAAPTPTVTTPARASARPAAPPAPASAAASAAEVTPPVSPSSAPSAAPARSLAEEVAMLEAARAALGGGDAPGALAALDRYSQRFPSGILGREAMVLRIEALRKKGDRASARELGHRFLAAYPRDAYAARVRSLLGDTNDP